MDLKDFIDTAIALKEKAEQGEKIIEATTKGHVKSEQFFRKVDAGYDQRLREMAREVVFGIWNGEKRDCSLKEIYEVVKKKIQADMEAGEWPKVWFFPSKRTVDRRVNELAEMNTDFWGDLEIPPCVCLKAGWYRPNPYLFDESIREDIVKAGTEK